MAIIGNLTIPRRYAPGPSFRAMELLLGRISSLGDTGTFTTQTLETVDDSGCMVDESAEF
jgi:hypothetical protein